MERDFIIQQRTPLVGAVPKRIVINVYDTPQPGAYGLETIKEGMDAQDWAFVHTLMTQALQGVASAMAKEAVRNAALQPRVGVLRNGERH